jgi:hypothetical protein
MTEWTVKRDGKNLGNIKLGTPVFSDTKPELFINIFDMPGSLQEEINKAIEFAKVKYMATVRRDIHAWDNKPVTLDLSYLHIILSAEKDTEYLITTWFHDPENEGRSTYADLEVDLSKHEKELKSIAVKAFVNAFF